MCRTTSFQWDRRIRGGQLRADCGQIASGSCPDGSVYIRLRTTRSVPHLAALVRAHQTAHRAISASMAQPGELQAPMLVVNLIDIPVFMPWIMLTIERRTQRGPV